MAELETLFVRIETDLSAFKRGMAEARRETQGFAKDARSTFSGVGTALDLSPFRRELAASEAATKQSAERMRKAFAEVGKVQLESARQVLKTLVQSIGAQPSQPAAKTGAKSGRSAGENSPSPTAPQSRMLSGIHRELLGFPRGRQQTAGSFLSATLVRKTKA